MSTTNNQNELTRACPPLTSRNGMVRKSRVTRSKFISAACSLCDVNTNLLDVFPVEAPKKPNRMAINQELQVSFKKLRPLRVKPTYTPQEPVPSAPRGPLSVAKPVFKKPKETPRVSLLSSRSATYISRSGRKVAVKIQAEGFVRSKLSARNSSGKVRKVQSRELKLDVKRAFLTENLVSTERHDVVPLYDVEQHLKDLQTCHDYSLLQREKSRQSFDSEFSGWLDWEDDDEHLFDCRPPFSPTQTDSLDLQSLKSTKDFEIIQSTSAPEAPVEVQPFMDALRSVSNMFSTLSETKSNLLETTSDFKEFLHHVRDDGVTVKAPAVDNLADVIQHNIKLDTQHVKELSDTLKDGVDVNINVSFFDGVKDWLLSNCAPLKSLVTSIEGVSGIKRDTVCLIVCASLEIVRLKTVHTSKWFNLLGATAVAIAFKFGSTAVRGFVTAYYGTIVVKYLYDYFVANPFTIFSPEDAEEEETSVFPYSEGLGTKSLVQKFSEALVSIGTGIVDKLTLRDVCIALTTYRTLVSGSQFTLDSLANLCIDFANLLASPFGVKLFRRAYSRYPQMYVLLDYTFEVKEKLEKAEPFTPGDKEKFASMMQLYKSLKMSIPITSDNSVYLTALRQLETKLNDLEMVLRSRGHIGSRRRFRGWSFMMVGCSGSGKTRAIPLIVKNIQQAKYGSEYVKLMLENEDAYYYSFKAGKKYHDSFQKTVKHINIDDHGQIRKSNDPENCQYVQDIFIENNEVYTLPAAAVDKKELLEVRHEISSRSSNQAVFNIDQTHLTEAEAWYSRVECNNGGVINVIPKPKYRKAAAGAWGYTATDELRAKRSFDPEACDYMIYDLRPGTRPPGDTRDKTVKANGIIGKTMNWSELNHFLNNNYRSWEANEQFKYISDVASYEDPDINPLLIGPRNIVGPKNNAKPLLIDPFMESSTKEEVPKVFSESHSAAPLRNYQPVPGLDNVDNLTPDEMRALLQSFKMQQKATAVLKRPVIADYDTYEELSQALHAYYKGSIDVYTARGGSSLMFSRISTYCWGAVMGDKWAELAKSRRNEIDAAIYDCYKDDPRLGIVFPKEAIGGIAHMCDYDLQSWFNVILAGVIDIYTKITYMCEMTKKSLSETMSICSKLSWKAAAKKSVDDFIRLFSDLWLTYIDTTYTAFSILSFDNHWISWVAGAVVGLITTAKAVEVVACSDSYQRIGRVVSNPLNSKCTTKMKVKDCVCKKCMTFKGCLKNYNPGKASVSACTCESCTVPVLPKFEVFKPNGEEELEGLVKRNVWNIQFIPGKGLKPMTTQNITMICTELGVTNCHFFMECCRLYDLYPAGYLRFINWNNERPFDVMWDKDQWDIDMENDKAYWLNNNYCSFGGGIRTIVNSFISRHDPPVHAGRSVKMKYDRDNALVKYELVRVKINQRRSIVYTSGLQEYRYVALECEFQASPGMCGAPVMSADSAIKNPKFLGFIVGGGAGKEGSMNSYITVVTREEILEVLEKHSITPRNTNHLPSKVITVDVLPAGFVASDVEVDDHSVMAFNPITATKFKDCAGPIDVMPNFVSVWERDDGVIIYPMEKNRMKSVTDGPACNHHIYAQSVMMAAQNFNKYLPAGRRAFRLTTKQAIEGDMDEARFSARTSPGGKYILKGWKKSDIVTLKDDGSGSYNFDFSSPQGQEFLKDIETATAEREAGIISLSYANEFPKAEVLPREKVYEGKVRAVRGDDQDQVIADKKELACLSYLLKKASIASGLVVGKDPLSKDFDLMARLLQVFGNIDASDHSGWDTNYFRYKYQGIKAFIRLILIDATPLHLKAIDTCVDNMLYKIHLAHIRACKGENGVEFRMIRVIFEILHGMISGSYNTLNFNTIGHYIDVRYIALCLYSEKVLGVPYLQYTPAIHGIIPFNDINANLISFLCGDDALVSVSPAISWLNFESMRYMYANHNMVLTTDKKEGEASGHTLVRYDTKPAEFGFCKRTPRYCVEYGIYVWCLAITSLLKSLYYSEDFSDHEQVIDTFFRELSVWGRSIFEEIAPSVNTVSINHYDYMSPYCMYELALMAAVGGLGKKKADRIISAVNSELIDLDVVATCNEVYIMETLDNVMPPREF